MKDPTPRQDRFVERLLSLERKVAALAVRKAPAPSATRPDPAAAGVGAFWFDPTTGLPSWSTGTAWVHADGTPV